MSTEHTADTGTTDTDATDTDSTDSTDTTGRASGRDTEHESTPTGSGHSTAADQAQRNQEDESPS